MDGGTESAEAETVAQEVALTPGVRTNSRGRVRTILVSVTAVLALVIGAYGLSSSDSTQVDVAQQGNTTDEAADPDAGESTQPGADGVDEIDGIDGIDEIDAVGDEEIAGSDFDRRDGGQDHGPSPYFDGADGVIATDDGFVRLGWGPDGQTVETSANGLEWQTVQVEGLPGDGALSLLAAYGGTYVAIYEEWPQYDEAKLDESEFYFDEQESATQYLASSTDLTTWSLAELPDLESDSKYPIVTSVSGLAVGESGIAAVVQAYAEPPDELRILFDSGVVDQAELVNLCGRDEKAAGEAITFYSCDFSAMDQVFEDLEKRMAAAEDDEAREAIEREFDETFIEEREILVTVEPGTALHAQLTEVLEFGYTQSPSSVLQGPVGGPFTVTELATTGYASGIVAVDGEFVAFVSEIEGRNPTTTVLASKDGTWRESGALEGQSINQAFVIGSNIVAVGSGLEEGVGTLVWLSDDGGATWQESRRSDLFGAWAQAVGGPGGVAIMVTGSEEPLPEYLEPEISLERDGYTLTTGLDGGRATLVGPNGDTIYDVAMNDLYDSAVGEGVVRVDGPDLVFLDAATGEDLVSFGERDFEEAYSGLIFDEEQFEEPTYTSQAMFSSDGLSWTAVDFDLGESESSNTQLVAVGDDEILFVKSTWSQPPVELLSFEQDGIEPTEAELMELDEWYSANNGGTTLEWIRLPLG